MKPRLLLVALVAFFFACPAAGTGPRGPGPAGGGGGGSAKVVDPDACGTINTSDIGRKVYAFLSASEVLDQSSLELEQNVLRACKRMASELQIATDGDTKTLCGRVTKELEDSLEVSISNEQRLVTKTEPAVCTTEVDFALDVVAECEASVRADVSLRCDGYCGGTCNGACDGSCEVKAADGSCAGTCEGSCQGSCTGSCQGSASVDASAECKASAEVQASVRTQCTEPKVVVVTENVTVVDASRLERAVKALEVGLPILLQTAAKAKIVAKAFVHWSKTAVALAASGADLFTDLGSKGICVGLQLAAAVAATADISARIDVSISVSASVSASAGS